MVRTRSENLIFFIVLKDTETFSGGNIQPYMAGYFHIHFKDCENIIEKKPILIIIFNKYK